MDNNFSKVAIPKWNRYYIEEKRLKSGTINNLINLINQICKLGVKRKLIKEHQLNIAKQKEICNSLKTLNSKDYEKMYSLILNNISMKNAGILLCMSTGIRIGELCALRWGDIDFDEGLLNITKTMQRISAENKTKIIVTSPKTVKSVRTIPLPIDLLMILKKIASRDRNDFILTNSPKCYEPRCFRRYYKSFCNANSINGLHVHSLRHTFATKLIQNGVDPKTVCELLGHSNIKTTLDLYVHPSMEQKRKILNELLCR